MSEQPTPAPGIDIPPSYVIDSLRQELATARDDNSIMQIKIAYQNEVIAALQAQVEALNHSHEPAVDDLIAEIESSDTNVE